MPASSPALPCPALSCPSALPYPVLPCPALSAYAVWSAATRFETKKERGLLGPGRWRVRGRWRGGGGRTKPNVGSHPVQRGSRVQLPDPDSVLIHFSSPMATID
ncbi:hypothetical protein BJ875DRAFT_441529 [Amylocarpus encephaloides]|uniref:Uncharacterized protein n=1 Tax=Amylocarpus encephaloides TaxID=45428 RepID=A0A9P7YIF5_9HELO|nr:hypothetical protein BJ875DRAFT_441529 [Amylocarpus encephaloides]